jgi:translation initiation factor 1
VPDRVVVRMRVEKAGRGGKTVTVVEGLARNRQFLKELLSELKRALGTGGTAADDRVEVQGDHREALRALLGGKGWTVKG